MLQEHQDVDHDFANRTTMHGIQRLASDKPRLYKFVWVVIVTAAVAFCVWQVVKRIETYLEYNVNTRIQIEYPDNLTFPAVTICNFNRYRISKLSKEEIDHFLCLIYSEVEEYDSEFLNEYEIHYQLQCSDWLGNNAFSIENLTEKAGFDLDEEILWTCKFRGQNCSAENFTSVFTDYGQCWTFNSDSKTDLKQLQPGFGNGLQVTINVAQYEYSESIATPFGSIDAGLRVLVHPKDTPPMVSSHGVAIGTGFHAYAAIELIELHNLEAPWGQCQADQQLTHYATYSYTGCIMECKMRYFVQRCGCKPVRYLGQARVCEPEENGCVKDTLFAINNDNALQCDCSIDCLDTTYDTKLSYANIPNDSVQNETMEVFNTTSVFIKNNVVILDVYYTDIVKQVYRQTKAMTSSALLSDIGGQLGLFIGASLITVIEITEYIALKVRYWLTRSKSKTDKDKNTKEDVKTHKNEKSDKFEFRTPKRNMGYELDSIVK